MQINSNQFSNSKNIFPAHSDIQEINNFINYWEDWHNQWNDITKTSSPVPNIIKGWEIPVGNGGNKFDIWRYFPEPYWGNPFVKTGELAAVFLNINPGEGGDCQDIQSLKLPFSLLYNLYNNYNSYSKTVYHLSQNECYITTGWFKKKRLKWLNKLSHCLDSTTFTMNNLLCADLVPWHTPTVTGQIYKYIKTNQTLIAKHVLDHLAAICTYATYKNWIFAKGGASENVLDKLCQLKETYLYGNFRILVYDYKKVNIMVFVGGQGMDLPDPCSIAYFPVSNTINRTELTISQIIQEYT